MVNTVKPRYTNKLQSDFAGCIRKALSDYFGVDDAQCPVIYTGQPIPQTAKRCVTFCKLNSNRLGFQGRKIITDCQVDSGFSVYENWIDELQFQVNARCKETIKDDENTPVARDIADGLTTWFNSYQGGEYMRSVNIFPLRVSDVRNITNTDESDLFQNISSFDVTVHIGQAKQMSDIASQQARFRGIVGVPLREGWESGLDQDESGWYER